MTGNEEWRWVVDYEGYYEVSDLGNVRGVTRTIERSDGVRQVIQGRPLNPFLRDGYPTVRMTRDGRAKSICVHRLVALAFLGEPRPDQEVCHNDGDRANANVTNLRWGTRKENAADTKRHGHFIHPNSIKVYCKRGHPLYGDNVRYDKRDGTRRCRACARWRYHQDMRKRAGLEASEVGS